MIDISVVLPSFNKASYVYSAVCSLIKNECKLEIILIDDCSDDDSGVVYERIRSEFDSVVTILKNRTNRGANYCRNRGGAVAKGEFLVFFDADDILSEGALDKRVKFMKNNVELDFCLSGMEIFDAVVGDRRGTWNPRVKHPLESFLCHDLPWQTMQATWRRGVFLSTGGFDERFYRLQDVEFFTRILGVYNFRYGFVGEISDCYLRVSEVRSSTRPQVHLEQVIDSVKLYIHKFETIHPRAKSLLKGTVFEMLIRIIVFSGNGLISEEERRRYLGLLENDFIDGSIFRKILFELLIRFSDSNFHVRGLNRGIKKLAMLPF